MKKDDIWLFREGRHYRLFEKMGGIAATENGEVGYRFTVWAPAAEYVSVIGDFNSWNSSSHKMAPMEDTGLHTLFIPGVHRNALYKFHIVSRYDNYRMDKADPFARAAQCPPETASVTADGQNGYSWGDSAWMEKRKNSSFQKTPVSVYELHAGSWNRIKEEGNRIATFREMVGPLVDYIKQAGFTHIELMPISLHPYSRSWGYQTTGYFCVHPCFGSPEDFAFFVDTLHDHNIGVILDWVPSHFPTDNHGPGFFDGTHLFEYPDPRKGFHPDWKSYIFDYGRPEVRSFLLSSAMYWLETFHVDGLRVDAVASMLYLDYSRQEGQWIPNRSGGNEHLEAVEFLQNLNQVLGVEHPDVMVIAEESTAWKGVTRPTEEGGLGFHMKWDMGWMNDTLEYMRLDPVYRSNHQDRLSFRMVYAWSERFMLSLSHDEVVHGKQSLLEKMPGDEWRKLANLRLLYCYMWGLPGKKLLFMGGELGQKTEWNEDTSIPLELAEEWPHSGIFSLVRDLNHLYREEPSLYLTDFDPDSFEWIDASDRSQSVLSFLRKEPGSNCSILVVLNFTPVPRFDYRLGLPSGGRWEEILNSDAKGYGGSGVGNGGHVVAEAVSYHGRPFSAKIALPPLGALFLKSEDVG